VNAAVAANESPDGLLSPSLDSHTAQRAKQSLI
jgi:hypothetical protein